MMKTWLQNSWLYPRYIGIVYIEPALRRACEFVSGILLDIGCGNRRYEKLFTAKVDEYVGLDWPQLTERASPNIIGDAMKLPIKNGSVDAVLATELMEHLPFPDMFLSEVSRVLRPEGVLILTVPFMEPLHEEPRDYYRFTPYSLHLLLVKHGFAVQSLSEKGGWWSVVFGSFVNQAIYDLATRPDEDGRRHYGILAALVVPICAILQWAGYQLDRIMASSRYTLGYTVVAEKTNLTTGYGVADGTEKVNG